MIQFAGDAAAAPDASTPDPTREPPTDPGLAARMAALAATERLGDEIAELSAHIHAATYRLLELLRDFDAREGWSCGFRSCAHWLSWRTGISLGAAREKVRVARALGSLPLISAGMQRGALSYSKGRALTRVATAENEGKLMEFALTATASHVERMVRAWRRVDRWEEADEERARHESRYLTLYPDEDGMYVVRGRLDPEVGALLEQALEAAKEQLYGKVPSAVTAESASSSATPGIAATYGQRRADALGLVAEQALAMETAVDADATGADIAPDVSAGTSSSGLPAHAGRRTPRRADRFQVVLHVDEAALREADDDASGGDASTEGQGDAPPDAHSVFAQSGHRVPAETSRRLSCDASLVEMRHDAEGNVLDVGRKRRTVPPSIRRALEHRDRGRCCFPGCESRYTDAHHITHWADGGETKLDNLVLTCRFHHRLVHEGGFNVELVDLDEAVRTGGAGRPLLRFTSPDGRPVPQAPPVPALPADPVTVLEQDHESRGLEIDAWTPTPTWSGEPFDVGWAVDVLRTEPQAHRRA